MINKKILITLSFALVYFCVLNNPKFIKTFNVKMTDEHIILYSLIYLLLVYSTYRIVDKVMPTNLLEHLSNQELASILNNEIKSKALKDMKDKEKKDNKSDKEKCGELEADLLKNFMSDKDLSKTIEQMKAHPYISGVCKPEDKKKCNKLDMSKFVLKDSVPKCDYVLPEQYNLYKQREGYTPGDPASDPTMDTIINKENYIFFYVGFVILLGIYILVLMFKSVF